VKKYGLLKFSGELFFRLIMVNVLGVFLLGSMIFLSVSDTWLWICQICVDVFVVAAIYPFSWMRGESDVNRIKNKVLLKLKGKGFVAGLIAIIPNMIMSTVLLLIRGGWITAQIHGMLNTLSALWTLFYSPFAAFGLPFFRDTVYAGKVPNVQAASWVNIILICALPFVYALLSGIGYELGAKGFSIAEKIFYRGRKKR